MNINGNINLPGNITLKASGAAEIRNAYIERVTPLQEEAIAATLGLPQVGRIVFNITTGGLKTWDGGMFKPVSTDITGVTSQIAAIQTAIGPIISSTTLAFDPVVAGELSNIGLVTPTNIFDVFKAIDSSISTLKAPVQFTALSGVVITGPTDQQILKYNVSTGSWVNGGLTLSNIAGITVSTQEINHLSGVTVDVQTQFATLGTTISTQASEITALQDQVTQLSTPFTVAYTNSTTETVTHSRGVKYVNVVVVDAGDNQVAPSSVHYLDENSLIVTLSSAGTGTIIVS